MAGVGSAAARVLLGVLLVAPSGAAAQHEGPTAAQHAGLVSANALAGAVASAAAAWLSDGDVPRAFLLGAAGGTLSYAGKLTATSSFTGAPILGRQLAAVGHGIAANAGAGRGALSGIWLPFTPMRIRLPGPDSGWGVRLDLLDLTAILYGAITPELELDESLTFRYGTPVFVAPRHALLSNDRFLGAVTVSGTILVSGGTEPGEARRTVMAHEMVHVIQSDFAKVAVSYPVEDWGLGLLGPAWVGAPVRGGFLAELIEALGGGLRDQGVLRQLIESEAYTFVRRAPEWTP